MSKTKTDVNKTIGVYFFGVLVCLCWQVIDEYSAHAQFLMQ